ncbi:MULTISPECIES: tetratricopeptide repeat protein [Candidatus Ichthyocystis]|uniref:Uncharacterized protein n=1 Tax=Candidatus Ichthyocystis hellenicum TaxID=1561003 RepID=A0A0S4M5I3_9BURK|nr:MULTISPECIES: hypothetical protein [Ichthyocystis]CUT17400.1 conserved hypothetical protein [Candidatus Ichthyocystis hellenicum]
MKRILPCSVCLCLILATATLTSPAIAENTPGTPAMAVSTSQSEDAISALEEMNKIRYIQTSNRKKSAEALASRLEAILKNNQSPANKTVYAAVLSFLAKENGGLGGLSLAKKARKLLLEVISSNDPGALDGYAYITLGALYLRVPSWPLGFGDKKKAKEMIDKAIAQNPKNIDANFYLASYYIAKKNKTLARQKFKEVLSLPIRKSHTIGDEGRKREAKEALSSLS